VVSAEAPHASRRRCSDNLPCCMNAKPRQKSTSLAIAWLTSQSR
jgi:hypothetical protein